MSDPDSSTAVDEPRYRIGAVCRLTGISQHVLRVWEKRYDVVTPERSETDRRLYRESDVSRLSLLKTLVDRGQAIGSIAGLDNDELERRIKQSDGVLQTTNAAEKPDLVLFGESLALTRDDCAASQTFTLVGHYHDISEFTGQKPTKRLDVAVIEWPVLQPDSMIEITRCANRLNARHLILIYDYAPRGLLKNLASNRVTALRSPLDVAALDAVIGRRFGAALQDRYLPEAFTGPTPSRQFDDHELAYLAGQSSAIACECPMHLAQLISRLVHFEAYCGECESRNSEDMELHRYLHNTTSVARNLMERALERLIELEDLTFPPDT